MYDWVRPRDRRPGPRRGAAPRRACAPRARPRRAHGGRPEERRRHPPRAGRARRRSTRCASGGWCSTATSSFPPTARRSTSGGGSAIGGLITVALPVGDDGKLAGQAADPAVRGAGRGGSRRFHRRCDRCRDQRLQPGGDEEKMREAVRLAVRRCATLWTGKKPLVEVMLLEVAASRDGIQLDRRDLFPVLRASAPSSCCRSGCGPTRRSATPKVPGQADSAPHRFDLKRHLLQGGDARRGPVRASITRTGPTAGSRRTTSTSTTERR